MNYPLVALGELTKIRTGKLDANAANVNGAYPFFTCAVEPLSINTAAFDCKAVLVAGNGDLNVKYYEGKFNAYQRTYVIECLDESKLHPKYLYLFLDKYLAKLREQAIGGVIKYIKLGNLTDAKIMLPPLAEQKHIASILEKANQIKKKRDLYIETLFKLENSLFSDLFSSLDFEKITINKMLESKILLLHKDGNHGSLYPRSNQFGDEGVAFLTAKCISDNGQIDVDSIDKLNEQTANKLKIGWLEDGDVLLAHNASVGKVALFNGEFNRALIGTSLTAFRPNPQYITSQYLYSALRSDDFQNDLMRNMGQTTRNQVPITAQRELSIPIPPLALQLEFAKKLMAIRKHLALAFNCSKKIDLLILSVQDKAFTTGFNA